MLSIVKICFFYCYYYQLLLTIIFIIEVIDVNNRSDISKSVTSQNTEASQRIVLVFVKKIIITINFEGVNRNIEHGKDIYVRNIT